MSARGTDSTARRRACACGSRASRRARPTWPCATAGGPPGGRRLDTVTVDEHLGDRLSRRRPQRHHPAARTDRHRDVLRVHRRRAEQEDRPRRRLLDGLEQRVRRRLGEPVGVLDQHAPATCRRWARPPRASPGRACRRRRCVRPSGIDQPDVRVGAGERSAAGRCTRRTRHCGHCSAAAKARAATERPEPGGPVKSQACVISPGGTCSPAAIRRRGRDRPAQRDDRLGLTDEVGEDVRPGGGRHRSASARPASSRSLRRPGAGGSS